MNGKTIKHALLWTAVIGMMVIIFAFSAQPGPESDGLSNAAAEPIVELLNSLGDGLDEADMAQMFQIVGSVIRKLAHFAEYALLGLLLRLLCASYGWNTILLPILAGVLYAASDEVHQLFVPGRSGMILDVVLDGAGVCCGVYARRMIDKIRRK